VTDQLLTRRGLPVALSREEKRHDLEVLTEALWDIEAQLALVRAERAALMYSIQADLHPQQH
jgi:hypothetical protein